MSRKIYEVSFDATDVNDFVQHVRLLGSTCIPNDATRSYEVMARNEYPDNHPVAEIIAVEIRQAVIDLQEANPNGVMPARSETPAPVEEKRASSLADILKQRGPIPNLMVPPEETPGINPLADMSDQIMENASEEAMNYDPQSDDGVEEPTDMDTEAQEEHDYENAMPEQSDGSIPEFDTDPVTDVPDVEEGLDEDQFTGLRAVATSLNKARRDTFFREVGKLLDIDMTSETEIMHVLAESADLKRLLSVVLSRMDIQISMTVVDSLLRTKSETLKFRPDSVHSVEHYRRGASEMFSRVEAMLAEQASMEDLRTQIKTLEKALSGQQTQAARQISTLTDDVEAARRRAIPMPVFAARFNLYYMLNGQNHYLTVPKGTATANKPGEPVVYPLKYMGDSIKQSEAHRFLDLDSAKAQRDRVRKWPQNFAPFEGLSTRPDIHIARLGVDRVCED